MQAYFEKENPSSPNKSWTYDLPYTYDSLDTLQLSCRKLVGKISTQPHTSTMHTLYILQLKLYSLSLCFGEG